MRVIFSIFVALSLLFVSYASVSPSKEGSKFTMDEIYKRKIIGKWSEGETPYGIGVFEEGGIYKAWLYENTTKEKLLHSMKGKWWIENGRLYNTLDEITPPLPPLKEGAIVIDIIVDITDDSMTLIDEEGFQYTNKKIKE